MFERLHVFMQVVGRLADKRPREGKALEGLLVRLQGQNDMLMAAQDLPSFTKLHPGRITQRQALSLRQPFSQACPVPTRCCAWNWPCNSFIW